MLVRGRRFRFGAQLLPQLTTWEHLARAARLVEDLGFDTLWNWDHLMPFSGSDDGPSFETLTTLGALAGVTSRVRVGALVFGVPYRDPATLAKAAATVDHISDGRLEFAIGAGWAEREFKAYGLAFPPLAERFARLDETLQVLKSLWVQPRVTFEGRYYSLDNAACGPKPLQSPYPPVTVGGIGRQSLLLAAKHATASNAHGSLSRTAQRVELLADLCTTVGRNFQEIELSLHADVVVAPTHEKAERAAAQVAAQISQDLESHREDWVIGTPEEVAERINSYAEVGVSHLILHFGHPFDERPLRLFAKEVMPLFR